MRKPITVGDVISALAGFYLIGAFFTYIYMYGWTSFMDDNARTFHFYTAMVGFIIVLFTSVISIGYLIFKYLISHVIGFIYKIWNHPLIK